MHKCKQAGLGFCPVMYCMYAAADSRGIKCPEGCVHVVSKRTAGVEVCVRAAQFAILVYSSIRFRRIDSDIFVW